MTFLEHSHILNIYIDIYINQAFIYFGHFRDFTFFYTWIYIYEYKFIDEILIFFFFPCLFNRQSGTICRANSGACQRLNDIGHIIRTILCHLWTAKSWLRVHQNEGDAHLFGRMDGGRHIHQVLHQFIFHISQF